MTIQIDTREKPAAIQKIIEAFDQRGVQYFKSKLFVGDYMNIDNPRLVIDRKHNLSELCINVAQDRPRFYAELKRAHELGIHIIILCEHSNRIKTLQDVKNWRNPRIKVSPLAISGDRLYTLLKYAEDKYDVEFQFCDKAHTGDKIINLLSR